MGSDEQLFCANAYVYAKHDKIPLTFSQLRYEIQICGWHKIMWVGVRVKYTLGVL